MKVTECRSITPLSKDLVSKLEFTKAVFYEQDTSNLLENNAHVCRASKFKIYRHQLRNTADV